jgi:toxin-antitoxin system PIN domain toxin
VIAVDTNILVYAHREDRSFHPAAAHCLGELIAAGSPWAIPWPCVHEFLNVVTHPRIYNPPTPMSVALDAVETWLGMPNLVLLAEDSKGYWPVLRSLAVSGLVRGPQIHDARIAAICLQHGVNALWSADRDFGRFPALKVVNPLVSR